MKFFLLEMGGVTSNRRITNTPKEENLNTTINMEKLRMQLGLCEQGFPLLTLYFCGNWVERNREWRAGRKFPFNLPDTIETSKIFFPTNSRMERLFPVSIFKCGL